MATDEESFEETAQELFDEAPCGYIITRADGTILNVNRTFLALTGYERETLLAKTSFQQLLSIPARIYYDTHVAPLLAMQGYVQEIAVDLARPGREAVPVLLNFAAKRNAEGSAQLIRITVFDATDRRQYERELLRARRAAEHAMQTERAAREEAERASRAKDDFLALVSHELKTPLSAIVGWTQVLRVRSSGNRQVEEGLQVIERNARLQARLVDDLLDMSRIISGKMRFDVQQVGLANVLEAAVETITPAAQARGIRLQSVLDPTVSVAGDPGRLQQVFWNLLSNAVKFTPGGGYVRVVMERVNSHVEVRVADSGQGMSAEFIAHAFERFRQSESEGTQRTGGLGLGLALVKHLLEMHGGSISAYSPGEGLGSTFTVHLPVSVVRIVEGEQRIHPAALSHAVQIEHVSLSGVTVVIVDDEGDAREVVWRLLTGAGAEVVATSSAAEAFQAVERIKPTVLVSDVSMPGGDGYELIRKVRMLGEHVGRVPAIALSALSRLEDRTQALLSGYQLHLPKPVDPQELILAIASLAGRLGPSNSESEQP